MAEVQPMVIGTAQSDRHPDSHPARANAHRSTLFLYQVDHRTVGHTPFNFISVLGTSPHSRTHTRPIHHGTLFLYMTFSLNTMPPFSFFFGHDLISKYNSPLFQALFLYMTLPLSVISCHRSSGFEYTLRAGSKYVVPMPSL